LLDEVLVLVDFFLGDSLFFDGDLGDLAFGDSVFFFGDLVVLALAALAFLGEVASFFGLGVFLTVVDTGAFFVAIFLVVAFFGDLVDFLGDLAVVVAFFEFDVDLFFGDDGAVVVVPEVVCVVVEDVVSFLVVGFFFF